MSVTLINTLEYIMKIITKFTIATEQGVAELLELTEKSITEKLSGLITDAVLTDFITVNYNKQTLISELNSMSNQFLVVYADDVPAGYARITSKGKQPLILENKRCIRIADFGILQHYNDEAVRHSLFEKCMAVAKFYESIWISEYSENPLLPFFEDNGFTRQEVAPDWEGLSLSSVCLIK